MSGVEARSLGGDAALITMTGRFGPLEAGAVADAIEPFLEPEVQRIVVDATTAEVDDGAVLEVLMDAARDLRQRDGVVALAVSPTGSLAGILAATGFDAPFQMYPTLIRALDDLDLDLDRS